MEYYDRRLRRTIREGGGGALHPRGGGGGAVSVYVVFGSHPKYTLYIQSIQQSTKSHAWMLGLYEVVCMYVSYECTEVE
jgi:hypothetical protein